MAGSIRKTKPIALYRVLKEYDDSKEDIVSLRKLVSAFYTKLNAKDGKRVNIADAKNSRVEHVAESLYNTAADMYYDMNDDEQLMLDGLLRIYLSRGYEREACIERLCIQIEHLEDYDITERVELAARQVLGRGLSKDPHRQYHGPLFDNTKQ